MARIPIEVENFYHVYNRGVDKRKVFLSDGEYQLFLRLLFLLNDQDVESPSRRLLLDEVEGTTARRPLVHLCAYCLMSNHYHLLLQECTPGGISKFMQRLGTAYTLIFNERHERSGALFQGKFKYKLIDDEAYLMAVIDYMHLNPNSRHDGEGEKSVGKLADVDNYPWSSYHNYLGEKKNENLLYRDCLRDFIEIPEDYRAWLKSQHDFESIGHLTFD